MVWCASRNETGLMIKRGLISTWRKHRLARKKMAGSGWTHAETSGLLSVWGESTIQEALSGYVCSVGHLCRRFLRAFLRRALASSSLIRANSLLFLSLRCFARTMKYCSHKTIQLSRRVSSSYDAITRLSRVAHRFVTCQWRIMIAIIRSPLVRNN